MKTTLGLLAILCLFGAAKTAHAQGGAALGEWEGKWTGTLTNLPIRPDAKSIDVTREVGRFPTADNTCAAFKTTYAEGGVVRQIKDYRLCRGTGPNDLYVDEGGGVKLSAQLIGDVLVSAFKYGNLLLISSARLRGDVMEEDILTVDDKPAAEGIVTMRARSIQRLEFRRVKK
ncbi:MAG: hypothetical protein SF339_03960 [Blastocatellia bacterium]|nr:hypothetical protein [Blastocatellia bacterium]